jgi:uncharacterized protein (TIGR00369 family)
MDIAHLEKINEEYFAGLLGIRMTEVSKDKLVARVEVRRELCNPSGVMHGGAIMAFADTLGAVATIVNLQPGYTTTTIESKTNFIAAAKEGTVVLGECTPIHRGKRLMTWTTRVLSEDGSKLLAVVTQTQIVLEPR